MSDLLDRTAELVDIRSVSHDEARDHRPHRGEAARAVPWLTLDRVGDNLVARTELGRAQRLILAGHTDTVPVNDNDVPSDVDGDVLWGCGASDMKGGLAVMIELAVTVAEPGRRRHLRLLRQRGGGGRAQRARGALRGAPRPAGRRRRASSASRPTASSRPAARAPCASRSRLAGAAGPHRPTVDGPQRHPPPGRRPRSVWPPTRGGGR